MSRPKTLVEKVWDKHVVRSAEGEPDLLYVDLPEGAYAVPT
jgi:3-isopropylmalate/(R)-2-methylmalate dehydratase large subunit